MNQTQRNFLVEKVKAETRKTIRDLEEQKQSYPNASTFIFEAVLHGKLKVQPEEHILGVLRERAKGAKTNTDWLSGESYSRLGFSSSDYKTADALVRFKLKDIVELPEEYYRRKEEVKAHNDKIQEQIDAAETYLATLEVRIQLASPKTLQALVNDVDNLGDISLVDSKIKLLNQ